MPELEEEDARELFLHYATPDFQSQGGEDGKCIRRCLNECRFSRAGKSGQHFLPLALKVLGLQMHGMGEDPRNGVESLSKENKSDVDRKKEHPIFYIFGRGYDSLRPEDQLLFMDVVLCNPHWKRAWGKPAELWTLSEWLSIVHYGSTSKESSIRDRSQGLKSRALLEDVGDGRGGVLVHDLYHKFVNFEASRGDLDARRVVTEGFGSRLCALQELALTGCHELLDGLPRLHEVVSLQSLKIENYLELEVFPDLCMLTRLRSLNLFGLPQLELIPGLGGLVALKILQLKHLRKLRELPNVRALTKLRLIELQSVDEVWEQRPLLHIVPSQLRYFSLRNNVRGRHCFLRSKEPPNDMNSLDLHEWYKCPSATVLRRIHVQNPNWCVPQVE